jgi:hypothetical protein
LTDAEMVGEAVRLVAAGVRQFGFKGQIPRLRRRVGGGTVQTVYLVRQQPFRQPMFSVGLSVVPAVLLEAWEVVAPRTLERFNKARAPIGGLDYGSDLHHADGHHDPGWHAPQTTAEAEEVATEVIRQFERAGLPWLERYSDPIAVVERAGDRDEHSPYPPGGRLLAAALLEVLPSDDQKLLDLVESTLFVMSYQRERRNAGAQMGLGLGPTTPDGSVAAQQQLDLDNWLADRLIEKAGFTPDQSSWPQRSEDLTRQLSQQREQARQAFTRGLQALGIKDEYRDAPENHAKLSSLLGPKLSAHFEHETPSDPSS